MASGLLSLKWNNHKSTFFHVLSTIRSKDSYSDVTIACDGMFYDLHKFVLSTCSEYFEEMFERTQGKHPVIVLKDIKHEDLESLLSYMYVGEVNVVQEKLACLIKAAECLKIKGLAVPDEDPLENKGKSNVGNNRENLNNKRSQRQSDGVSPRAKRRRRENSELDVSEDNYSITNRNNRFSNSQNSRESNHQSNYQSGSNESSNIPCEEILEPVTKSTEDRQSTKRNAAPKDEHVPDEVILDDDDDDDTAVKCEPIDIPDTNAAQTTTANTSNNDNNNDQDDKEALRQELGFDDSMEHEEDDNTYGDPALMGEQSGPFPWEGDGSLPPFTADTFSTDAAHQMIQSEVKRAKSAHFKYPPQNILNKSPTSTQQLNQYHNSENCQKVEVHQRHELSNFSLSEVTQKVGDSFISWEGSSFPADHRHSTTSDQSVNFGFGISDLEHAVSSLESQGSGFNQVKCSVCYRSFSSKGALTRHYLTHTGVKPHQCKFCNYKTSLRFNLVRHQKSHHPAEEEIVPIHGLFYDQSDHASTNDQ